MPDDAPESGVNREDRAAERIDTFVSGVAIVLVTACMLFDAPTILAGWFIAWGWA